MSMQHFAYTAKDSQGKTVRATLMAADEIDLANKLGQLGYYLIQSRPLEAQQVSLSPAGGVLRPKEVLDFTLNLATLLNAGMTMVEALSELGKDADRPAVKRVIQDVLGRVQSGVSLRESLLNHPRSFSRLYVSIVGAGENTGKLITCLNDLAAQLEWQQELGARVKEASTYPAILFSVMICVVLVLVVKVIPTFAKMFDQSGAQLPGPTQFVLNVSGFVRSYWYLLVIAGVGAVAGFKTARSVPAIRLKMDAWMLRIPVIGELLRKIALSRFCHTLSLSLKSGVSILVALEFSAQVVDNLLLEKVILKARDAVNVGEKIAPALKESGEFSPLVIRMISIGEQSGSLSQTLEKVNQFYDREVPVMVRRLFAMVEPVMIVLMGFVVGGIVLAIFLPIFQMAKIAGG